MGLAGQAGEAGQTKPRKCMVGKAYAMFVCICITKAMLLISGTLLQIETPSGHIWNVFTWCPIKLSWKSIWLKRMRFIILCASQRHGNTIYVEWQPSFGRQKL